MSAGGFRLPSAADILRAAQLRRSRSTSVLPLDTTASAAAAETDNADATADLTLPPSGETGRWMAALVARDGPDLVARALLGAIKGEDLARMIEVLCNNQWGPEPLLASGGLWESAFSSTADPGGFQLQASSLKRSFAESGILPGGPGKRNDLPPTSVFHYGRCWHCEPEFNKTSEECDAMQLLCSLSDDIEAQGQTVEENEGGFEPAKCIRRAARYFMYRKWVAIRFDNIPLGKGHRVRIPKCVVEEIRHNFREPGCNCTKGGQLYACSAHGYTGHREAPSDD